MISVTYAQFQAWLAGVLSAYNASQNILNGVGSTTYILIAVTPGKPNKMLFYSDPSFTNYVDAVEDDSANPPAKAVYDAFVSLGAGSGSGVTVTAEGGGPNEN